MKKTIVYFLGVVGVILSTSFSCYSQLSEHINVPEETKIVFIGEAHRVLENHEIQYRLISNFIDNNGFNGIVIEQSSAFQPIIDNMISTGDTTNLHLILPVVICKTDGCNHDFESIKSFFISLTSLARIKNVPIYCFDTEENFLKTKNIIMSMVDSSTVHNHKGLKYFEELRNLKYEFEIKESLYHLYKSINKWKTTFDDITFNYLNSILTNIDLQKNQDRTFRFREEYLFDRFNQKFEENSALKLIAIFGLAHTNKHYNSEGENVLKARKPSVASLLNECSTSLCKSKVFTIATNYFFNDDIDKEYTKMGCFEFKDLTLIKEVLGSDKYKIIQPKEMPINSFIKQSYDLIIAVNDCKKLFNHTKYYR